MDFKFKIKSHYCLKLKNKSFKLKIQYSIFPLKQKDIELRFQFKKENEKISEYKLNKKIKKEIDKLKDEINIYKQLLFELFEQQTYDKAMSYVNLLKNEINNFPEVLKIT